MLIYGIDRTIFISFKWKYIMCNKIHLNNDGLYIYMKELRNENGMNTRFYTYLLFIWNYSCREERDT